MPEHCGKIVPCGKREERSTEATYKCCNYVRHAFGPRYGRPRHPTNPQLRRQRRQIHVRILPPSWFRPRPGYTTIVPATGAGRPSSAGCRRPGRSRGRRNFNPEHRHRPASGWFGLWFRPSVPAGGFGGEIFVLSTVYCPRYSTRADKIKYTPDITHNANASKTPLHCKVAPGKLLMNSEFYRF